MKQITDYSVSVATDWHQMPAVDSDTREWARAVVDEVRPPDALAPQLEDQLTAIADRVLEQVGSNASTAVWVPMPEAGLVGAVMSIMVWRVGDGYDDLEAFLAEPTQDLYAEQWTGDTAVGPFAARHLMSLLPRDDGDEHDVVEMVDFVVFPDECTQFVQIVFTAESVAAFEDMPAQTEAVVRTLELAFGEAQ